MMTDLASLMADEPRQLIVPGAFTSHSGLALTWKIECDALTDADLAGIAVALTDMLFPFGSVEGVPRGGLRLAEAIRPYATEGPLLIVDDVSTTGASLEAHRAGREAIGAVIFARGPLPVWCRALFSTEAREQALLAERDAPEATLAEAARNAVDFMTLGKDEDVQFCGVCP